MANEVNRTATPQLAAQLKALGGVLGLLQRDPSAFLQGAPHQIIAGGIPSGEAFGAPTITAGVNIQEQIEARIAAKKAKNFAEADRIRKELLAAGIVLEDSASGTTWRRA